MKFEPDEVGTTRLAWPSGSWEAMASMSISMFAGQMMVAVAGKDGAYELHFLGYVTRGYATLEEARTHAGRFALAVIERLGVLLDRPLGTVVSSAASMRADEIQGEHGAVRVGKP